MKKNIIPTASISSFFKSEHTDFNCMFRRREYNMDNRRNNGCYAIG